MTLNFVLMDSLEYENMGVDPKMNSLSGIIFLKTPYDFSKY